MAELSRYELDRRGRHIIAEMNGYTILQKIQLLHYLLDLLLKHRPRGNK